jgi:excisionase family DNA binding protein
MNPKTYSTGEAAEAAGISRATLQAWIANKKIAAPKAKRLDKVTIRIWTASDLARLCKTKESVYWKGQGRPRKKD